MLSIQELRSSTNKELLLELEKSRKDLVKIRIHVKTKHEKDSTKVTKAKRYVAQILSVLKSLEKEELLESLKDSSKDKETEDSKK